MLPSPERLRPDNEAAPNWPDLLNAFLASRREGLLDIFHATGVRECWLQGEAHRYFRALGFQFEVNGITLARRQTADFAFFAPDGTPSMVAELKVYGAAGYFTKNLTGNHNINRFMRIASRNQRFTFCNSSTHRAFVNPRESSILKDFFRLCDFKQQNPAVAAYLLLVVDVRDPADAFGKALLACDFGGPAVSLIEQKGLVFKLWEIA
jgi:hypothetical protein